MDWFLPLGALALAVLLLALCVWIALVRSRAELRALRRSHLALALHLVGEPLRRDPAFVRLLEAYRKAPRSLAQEDRIRARSWYRSASRVYGLTLEESSPSRASAAWGAPSMGEHEFADASPDLPSIEELIKLDPEFMSYVDAMREG